MQLLTQLRSPYVVLFMGVCRDPLAMVTEYCARGSVFDVLMQARVSPSTAACLTWQRRLRMALDAALGMSYLHSRGVLHRDFKSPNLFVDSEWRVKVGDLGLSTLLDGSQSTAGSTLANVNLRWVAPEVVEELTSAQPAKQPFTKEADVYGFGVVLRELATFQVPYAELDTQYHLLLAHSRGELCPAVPPVDCLPGGAFPGWTRYSQLMQVCWAPEAAKRPPFETIVEQLSDILRRCKGWSA